MSNLHATRKLFLDSVEGVSDAQWTYKPSPEAWSIAEVAEHIALSEDFIGGRAQKLLAEAATPEKKHANPGEIDRMLVRQVPIRDKKFQAPEPIRPRSSYKSKADLIAAFGKSRDANIAFLRDSQQDLRAHLGPHPAFGPLDIYQWYLLISSHSERHVNQIKEIMATPGYPQK